MALLHSELGMEYSSVFLSILVPHSACENNGEGQNPGKSSKQLTEFTASMLEVQFLWQSPYKPVTDTSKTMKRTRYNALSLFLLMTPICTCMINTTRGLWTVLYSADIGLLLSRIHE